MTEENYILYNTKVDELGRIILPKKIKNKFHINTGDSLFIEIEEDIILLSKENNYCIFCGSEKELINLKHKHICSKCICEIRPITFLIL